MTKSIDAPIRVALLEPPMCMETSLALSRDVLATANKVARGLGIAMPFDVVQTKVEHVGTGSDIADVVVLPGLGLDTAGVVEEFLEGPEIVAIVQALNCLRGPQTTLATSCTGVFAFGQAGLIDGRQVTTTWWLAPLLQARFPRSRLRAGELVIQDGRIVTAGAALAHVDLMMHLVESLAGAGIADACRRYLVVDARSSQMPYTSTATLVAADPALRKAELFVRQNMSQPLSAAEIAAASGLGMRTFARRMGRVAGMTPNHFLQSIRVSRAVRLACTSARSNDEIAVSVGYSDATSLRRAVKRMTGMTLEEFRRRRVRDGSSNSAGILSR